MTRTTWMLLTLVVGAGGCKSVEVAAEVPMPTVPEQTFQVLSQSLTDCTAKFTGVVEAASEPVHIERVAYEFVVDGEVVQSGEKALGLDIAAASRGEFSLEESVTYVKDEAGLKAMDSREGGSILMALRGHLKGRAGTKPVELEFARSKDVRTPRLPHLKFMEFEAGRFGDTEMQVVFHLGVVNPNPFAVSVSEVSYAVSLAGKEVAHSTVGAGEKVGAASTAVFDVTALLNEDSHGKDAAKLIKGLVIDYEFKGQLKAALYAEPLSKLGSVKLKPAK